MTKGPVGNTCGGTDKRGASACTAMTKGPVSNTCGGTDKRVASVCKQ
jgi:hypothetical protein